MSIESVDMNGIKNGLLFPFFLASTGYFDSLSHSSSFSKPAISIALSFLDSFLASRATLIPLGHSASFSKPAISIALSFLGSFLASRATLIPLSHSASFSKPAVLHLQNSFGFPSHIFFSDFNTSASLL